MMRKIAYMVMIMALFLNTVQAQVLVQNLRCENRMNPLGIDMAMPRLSWQLHSGQRNVLQTAYEIQVRDQSGKNQIWGSGKKLSSQSLYVPYSGPALKSGETYYWKVRIWDNKGNASVWSQSAFWQMGLLQASDWKANWITSPSAADTVNGPAILFRKQFNATKRIVTATAFITAHGMYEAYINGKKIGSAFLLPGWTSYNKRLQYQVYDLSSQMEKASVNTIGITIGSGWYRTNLAWNNNRNIYGTKVALLFQLELKYSDGSMETIVSDESWKASDNGPIRFSEMYNGELFDDRKNGPAWKYSDFDDHKWVAVQVNNYPKENLVATYNEPVTKHESFAAIKMIVTPRGEHVIDFGQNLVGWEQIRLNGSSGDSLIVDHAEVLDKQGNFYTENLRAAKARNVYILNGIGTEFFEPHFTFQGFRYIRISGFKGELKLVNISATALYSDMHPTGYFSCSNALLNKLQHNIQWGQKGNFLDVPTDCPQRDERLGWTGDAQAFSRTATFNMDVHNFFAKWLKDVAADQNADGRVPFVVPNVLDSMAGGSAGWSDVATIIPWNMWLAYGDVKILKDQYASMKRWVDFMQEKSTGYLWNSGFHFGDWLFYRPEDDNSGLSAVTDKYLIAQCFFANSTEILVKAAKVLGMGQDVKKYSDLLTNIKNAFLTEYVTPSGRLVSGTQTAYVLALQFNMLPEHLRKQAAARLVNNIADYEDHLTTGFLGTPYLCHVLTRFGYDSIAYKLLMQETYPSWLYPVKMGATTIWERWDGLRPDSSFQTPGMNSFNHYAYGAIGDWMYRIIAGIDTDDEAVGYKKIRIRPHPGGNLTSSSADLETGYGKISIHWEIANGTFYADIEIPANTTATIYMPAENATDVFESHSPVTSNTGMVAGRAMEGYIPIEIGSGVFHFSILFKR